MEHRSVQIGGSDTFWVFVFVLRFVFCVCWDTTEQTWRVAGRRLKHGVALLSHLVFKSLAEEDCCDLPEFYPKELF